MSHLAVVIWSVCMAIIATGITRTTIGVNYLVTCMGVFTSCAVWPFYCTILWSRQNKVALVCAPILGSITAIACWLGSTHALYGTVSVATTSNILPLVIGNAVSLVSGALYSIVLTFVFGPDTFDWDLLKTGIRVVDDSDIAGLTAEQIAQQLAGETLTPDAERSLRRGKFKAILTACVLCAIFVVIFPMPMYGTNYVFSKPFFRFWVALTFVWAFAATLVITVMPLWEGRRTIALFFSTMIRGREPPRSVEGVVVRKSGEDEQTGEVKGEKGACTAGEAIRRDRE